SSLFSLLPRPPTSLLFPYTTLFRSSDFGNLRYCLSNRVFQSQRLGSGTSRTFFGASARSIAFSASTTASDLLYDWPVITTFATRSEEHTSELQSRSDLVCRLLLEKK